jgi:hypothetical protein
MKSRFVILVLLCGFLLLGCARDSSIESSILSEINGIRAIDNHAHPVRFAGSGPADREFDALPVDTMEPQSDPLQLRPDSSDAVQAWKTLWNYPYNDTAPQHINEWKEHKQSTIKQKGNGYPEWILDQMGIDIMMANRVHMGPSIEPPRFRWVPYVDALMFPLDNSHLAGANADRKLFFDDIDAGRSVYLKESGITAVPPTLNDYLRVVVTPALERHKQGGAIAEKFEIAYLRPFGFDKVERAVAEKVYSTYVGGKTPTDDEYKILQDYLYRFIAAECGRLGMVVHMHTGLGAGGYFDARGANPLLLEPLFDDPDLRKTNFVMLHGGWPYTREVTALLTKPNAYLDFSMQPLLHTPATLAPMLREWLEFLPEKVLFGTDASPYSDAMGWEETGWISAKRGRQALAIALTAMMHDGEISRERALELARMVLRENAKKLYGF